MEFSYRVNEQSVEITHYLGNESEVQIPAELEGKPVTSIGKYAFEGKNELLEVVLPNTIESIGAHAFYNCRRLVKMTLSDRILSTEDGAFKNCRSLREFHIQVYLRKMTCLKNLLSELNQEIHVTMENMDTHTMSKLVFPSYLYDYVDNVEARIINQVTYGSGVHYRECMKEKEVDYKKYDEVFRVARLNDTLETLFTIARDRLGYPYELSVEAKEEYEQYIQSNFAAIVTLCVEKEDIDGLLFLGDTGFYTKENIELAIQAAHQREQVECVSVLLAYKNKHFKVQKKTFDL